MGDRSPVSGPLAFPESLCRWFAEHGAELCGEGGAGRMVFGHCHDCEDCAYWVPGASGGGYGECWAAHLAARSGQIAAPGMPFLRCPVCGGATRWAAYDIRHATPNGFGSTFRPYSEAATEHDTPRAGRRSGAPD